MRRGQYFPRELAQYLAPNALRADCFGTSTRPDRPPRPCRASARYQFEGAWWCGYHLLDLLRTLGVFKKG